MSPNSTTSSQNACVEAGPLTNMGVTKDPAADMMNSLKQYYNENLVSHVSGWQAEHAERQVGRFLMLHVDGRCSPTGVYF